MNKNSIFSDIFNLLKPFSLFILISLFLTIISVAISLTFPILVGEAIDLIIGVNNVDFINIKKLLILGIICILANALIQWIISIINNKITYSCVHNLREKSFTKLQTLPFSYLNSHPAGDTLSRIVNDAETFADGMLLGFSQLFQGVLTIVGTLILMICISWKIAIIVVVLTPVSLLVAKFIATKTHNMFKLQAETKGEQTAYIDEIVGNQKTIKAFCHEDIALQKFDDVNNKLMKYSLKATFFSSMVNPSTRLINSLTYAIICLVGSVFVINNPLFTVGALTCLLSYAGQFAKPFNEISSVITELQNAFTCAERCFKLINEKSETSDIEKLELQNVNGNFEFKNVDFSYTVQKPLIQNLNLNVKIGQKIAIVGPTGCGKTTLINLIMRFYDVTNGAIYIDGNNIFDITRRSLRYNIGMVLQETWIKSGTIKENIKMGVNNATDEEIINAAKSTHAHKFIKRLPQGYETIIGEDGGNLSEGQKQLLCITRVMVAKPPILILDEATSSIDVHTEHYIRRAFDKLMVGRTSFVVAHRLSTIKDADIILVMKDGNIIEQGDHQSLLNKKGFYYELYNSQFAH